MSDFHEKCHEWRCPKCRTTVELCGDPHKAIHAHPRDSMCGGFICECDDEGGTQHGEVLSDPCTEAHCYHCGWIGTFPAPPKGMQAWEKKAFEAGWTPPNERALELGLAAINPGE